MGRIEAQRVINGTFGEMWLDGAHVGECYGLQLKVSLTKDEIQIPGQLMTDTKLKNAKGTGTLKSYKMFSRLAEIHSAAIKEGRDLRFTIISKLADPDAFGAERVCAKGVSFDDFILADWEAGVPGKVDSPLTFTDYDFLDKIGVR